MIEGLNSDERTVRESDGKETGWQVMKKYDVGDRVVKNPETWITNDFDSWGRGVGIGVVVDPPFDLRDDEADVRWPGGRCLEKTDQLLPYSTGEK